MRTLPINNYLFEKNRQKLSKRLPSHSLAIITSNDEMPRSADQYFPFHQKSDLFYLTGIEQQKTTLILCPDFPDYHFHEILFIEKTTEHDQTWIGNKLTKESASTISGIQSVFWVDDFETLLCKLMQHAKFAYLTLHESERKFDEVPTHDLMLTEKILSLYPLHHYERLSPFLAELRLVKETEEIGQIRKAIEITEKAFSKIIPVIKPGILEYFIEAEIIAEFIRNGSKGHAFQPIVASGASACILHYTNNSSVCNDNELVLIDFGAEYNHYNADITRILPINGKFNKRQRQVYDAVLRLHNQAASMFKPGITLEKINQEMIPFFESEMIGLGLFTKQDIKNQSPEKPVYKKYFMHGVSHFLGLDVHDSGKKTDVLHKGMIITCEPGIYIREENLGIRLENNFLITEKGAENLSLKIPIEPSEIENLMNKIS